MSDATKNSASQAITAHGNLIDGLHQKLAAMAGADKAKLQGAVDKYKAAHKSFHDDALSCMN
ncbi:MAG: hypothetical protein ACLQPV_05475 [Vulcanimicrobiaceae bacterium]